VVTIHTPTASFMSDAKWRKFFDVAASNALAVWSGVWKLLSEREQSGNFPGPADIWETAVDGCLNGPVDYRSIEWIEIPRLATYSKYPNAPASFNSQDVASFLHALNAAGQFQIEETERGFRVYGYK
jgi:hypothetical protein